VALVKKGGRTYLVRSIRVDGQVTSRCLASGEAAEREHLLDQRIAARWREEDEEEARLERQHRRKLAEIRGRGGRLRAERLRREQEVEAEVKGLAEGARELAAGAMRLAGFHQHRWTWRKRRGGRRGPNRRRTGA
jgi:hypothetical protein